MPVQKLPKCPVDRMERRFLNARTYRDYWDVYTAAVSLSREYKAQNRVILVQRLHNIAVLAHEKVLYLRGSTGSIL